MGPAGRPRPADCSRWPLAAAGRLQQPAAPCRATACTILQCRGRAGRWQGLQSRRLSSNRGCGGYNRRLGRWCFRTAQHGPAWMRQGCAVQPGPFQCLLRCVEPKCASWARRAALKRPREAQRWGGGGRRRKSTRLRPTLSHQLPDAHPPRNSCYRALHKTGAAALAFKRPRTVGQTTNDGFVAGGGREGQQRCRALNRLVATRAAAKSGVVPGVAA